MPEASILMDILKHRNQYGHFTVQVCLQKVESHYEMVFGRATAQKQGQDKISQSPLDFGDYVYAARCLEIPELLKIIQEHDTTFTIGPYSFVLKDATLRSSGLARLASNNFLCDWPTELFELRSGAHSNYIPPKPLVAHNCARLFHDQFDGIQQYMAMTISNNHNSGWIGAMLFILPNYDIRIREIVGEERDLIVKVENSGSLVDARLHCLVDGAEGRQEMSRVLDQPEIRLQLTSGVDRLETIRVYITDAAHGLLDSYEQLPTLHSGRIRWLSGGRRDDRKEIMEEIRKGEGTNLEFKPFIRIGKGEKKEIEVIRAAIAFANTGGGTVLFGINNTGEIEGIEKDLSAIAPKLDTSAAGEQYGLQLRTMVNDATNERLDLHSSVLEIANHILVRMDVKELPAVSKPVWHLPTKDTWIRRGSTNMKADPDTIRNSFGVNPNVDTDEWIS